MKKEIENLYKFSGKKFDARLKELKEKYNNSEAFKAALTDYMKRRLVITGQRLEMAEKEINLRNQLSEVPKS